MCIGHNSRESQHLGPENKIRLPHPGGELPFPSGPFPPILLTFTCVDSTDVRVSCTGRFCQKEMWPVAAALRSCGCLQLCSEENELDAIINGGGCPAKRGCSRKESLKRCVEAGIGKAEIGIWTEEEHRVSCTWLFLFREKSPLTR